MKKRLTEFLAYLGIGQNKFEERVGLSRGFVNTLNDNMTVKNVAKIRATYPELNMDYLCYGEGEMLKSNGSIIQSGHDNKMSDVHQNRNCGSHSGNYGTISYTGMSHDELVVMMEERFHYLQQKEDEILRKNNHIDQIWEENRNLTATVSLQVREQSNSNAAYQRQMERIEQINNELRDRDRQIAELRERLAKYE